MSYFHDSRPKKDSYCAWREKLASNIATMANAALKRPLIFSECVIFFFTVMNFKGWCFSLAKLQFFVNCDWYISRKPLFFHNFPVVFLPVRVRHAQDIDARGNGFHVQRLRIERRIGRIWRIHYSSLQVVQSHVRDSRVASQYSKTAITKLLIKHLFSITLSFHEFPGTLSVPIRISQKIHSCG